MVEIVVCSTRLEEVLLDDTGKRAKEVVLKGGERLKADAVVVGVGASPSTRLVRQSTGCPRKKIYTFGRVKSHLC